MKWLLGVLVFLLLIGTASAATTFGPSEPGWYKIEDVTDLTMSGALINESDLAISQVYLLKIYSGTVSDITVVSNTYSAHIVITEPDWFHTNINITFINSTGDTTIKDYSVNHIGKSFMPIYILIGTPPADWGLSQNGVIGKVYYELHLEDLLSLDPDSTIYKTIEWDLPPEFWWGWDTYYDGQIDPPQTFNMISDGPIDVMFEVTTIQEVYERRDRGIGALLLSGLKQIPYVGPIAAGSLLLIFDLFKFFINVLILGVENWAIFFILIETFILLHGATVIFSASNPLDAIIGFMAVFVADNVELLKVVMYVIVEAFGLLFAIISSLRNLSPI